MRKLKSKRHMMKYRFLKDKFLVYFGIFTLPLFLLGMLFLGGIYITERAKVQEKQQTSLRLAVSHVNSFYEDANTFQNFFGSAQRTPQFYNFFQKRTVDYDAVNALCFFSAYMISWKNERADVESAYFYLDNPFGRVATSGKFTENVDTMRDQGWRETLIEMKGNETFTTVRKENADTSAKTYFSVFRRYPNYKGGMVINYKLEEQKRKMQQMTFFKGQYLLLMNQEGDILFSNYQIEEDKREKLISCIENASETNKVKRIKMDRKYYLIDTAVDCSGSLNVVTLVPYSVVNSVFLSNMKTLIFLVVITTIASAYLAYDRAVRNYKQLSSIIDVFERAEKNMELPQLNTNKDDLYDYILNNIIHTFLENSYLQMQLSEKRYRQISAQMLALQYQINPHFLFNTLQAINYEIMSEVHGQYTGNANRMVETLSDVLRYALDTSKEEASVKEEIEVCKKYIDIQKMREERNFSVEWVVMREVETCKIRRMLLQPLLENAISHGLRFKDNGKLRISVQREGKYICFKVIDNGVGISPGKLAFLRDSLEKTKDKFESEHIGLTNVNQRLILAYGEEAGIRIFSKEGLGTIQYFKIEEN